MQHYQCIDTKHSDKQRLRAMDYQRKNRCVGCADAIKHHYAYDSEMPGTCTVRGRHNHRDASCDKKHKTRKE